VTKSSTCLLSYVRSPIGGGRLFRPFCLLILHAGVKKIGRLCPHTAALASVRRVNPLRAITITSLLALAVVIQLRF